MARSIRPAPEGPSRCAPSARSPVCDGISIHLGVSGLDEGRRVGRDLIGPSEFDHRRPCSGIACENRRWLSETTIKQLTRRAEADCLVGGARARYAGQLSEDCDTLRAMLPGSRLKFEADGRPAKRISAAPLLPSGARLCHPVRPCKQGAGLRRVGVNCNREIRWQGLGFSSLAVA
jgi:hypothetical protein